MATGGEIVLPLGWRIALIVAVVSMGVPVLFFTFKVLMWLWIEMLDQIYELFD